MWTDNTRNANIKGGIKLKCLRYLMVMKILILIFFFLEIKESKLTRGHNSTLVKKQGILDV